MFLMHHNDVAIIRASNSTDTLNTEKTMKTSEIPNTSNASMDDQRMLGVVSCPNLCFNGMVKIYEYERALYDLVKCPYCKGKGEVTEAKSKEIEGVL
jgi:hypothetical protein